MTRTALITGATRGIGRGIAGHLAEAGWHLTIVARDRDALERVSGELCDLGAPSVTAVAEDLADEAAAARVVEAHREVRDELSLLVLVAGVGSAAPLENYSMRRFDKQFAVNIRAPFELVARSISLLKSTAGRDTEFGARVIVLSSMEGAFPESGLAAYSASKAAVESLVRSINAEGADAGVSATGISPGYVDTEMSTWVHDRIPQSSMIPVADIVGIVRAVIGLAPQTVLPHVLLHRRGEPNRA